MSDIAESDIADDPASYQNRRVGIGGEGFWEVRWDSREGGTYSRYFDAPEDADAFRSRLSESWDGSGGQASEERRVVQEPVQSAPSVRLAAESPQVADPRLADSDEAIQQGLHSDVPIHTPEDSAAARTERLEEEQGRVLRSHLQRLQDEEERQLQGGEARAKHEQALEGRQREGFAGPAAESATSTVTPPATVTPAVEAKPAVADLVETETETQPKTDAHGRTPDYYLDRASPKFRTDIVAAEKALAEAVEATALAKEKYTDDYRAANDDLRAATVAVQEGTGSMTAFLRARNKFSVLTQRLNHGPVAVSRLQGEIDTLNNAAKNEVQDEEGRRYEAALRRQQPDSQLIKIIDFHRAQEAQAQEAEAAAQAAKGQAAEAQEAAEAEVGPLPATADDVSIPGRGAPRATADGVVAGTINPDSPQGGPGAAEATGPAPPQPTPEHVTIRDGLVTRLEKAQDRARSNEATDRDSKKARHARYAIQDHDRKYADTVYKDDPVYNAYKNTGFRGIHTTAYRSLSLDQVKGALADVRKTISPSATPEERGQLERDAVQKAKNDWATHINKLDSQDAAHWSNVTRANQPKSRITNPDGTVTVTSASAESLAKQGYNRTATGNFVAPMEQEAAAPVSTAPSDLPALGGDQLVNPNEQGRGGGADPDSAANLAATQGERDAGAEQAAAGRAAQLDQAVSAAQRRDDADDQLDRQADATRASVAERTAQLDQAVSAAQLEDSADQARDAQADVTEARVAEQRAEQQRQRAPTRGAGTINPNAGIEGSADFPQQLGNRAPLTSAQLEGRETIFINGVPVNVQDYIRENTINPDAEQSGVRGRQQRIAANERSKQELLANLNQGYQSGAVRLTPPEAGSTLTRDSLPDVVYVDNVAVNTAEFFADVGKTSNSRLSPSAQAEEQARREAAGLDELNKLRTQGRVSLDSGLATPYRPEYSRGGGLTPTDLIPVASYFGAVGEVKGAQSPGGNLVIGGEKGRLRTEAALTALEAVPIPAGALLKGGARVVRNTARVTLPTQVTLPGGRVVSGPGGFIAGTTPAQHVPKIQIPRGPEGEAFREQVLNHISRSGEDYRGVYGTTEITYRPDRLSQALHQANPDQPIFMSATPRSDLVAPGPIAIDKPALGPAEQYYFATPGGVNPNFMRGSAFGGTGAGSPGIHVYSPADAAAVGSGFVPIREADGTIKYFRGGYEAERGIPSGQQIPPSSRVSTSGIPGGQLYLAENVAQPTAGQRLAANVKALTDPGNSQRGQFNRSAVDLDDPSSFGRQQIDARIESEQTLASRQFDADVAAGRVDESARAGVLDRARQRTQGRIADEQRALDEAAETDVTSMGARDDVRANQARVADAVPETRAGTAAARYNTQQEVFEAERAAREPEPPPPVHGPARTAAARGPARTAAARGPARTAAAARGPARTAAARGPARTAAARGPARTAAAARGPARNRRRPWASRYHRRPWTGQNRRRPWASQYRRRPWASRYHRRPWASRYRRRPWTGQYRRRPWASRYHRRPWASQYHRRPWASRYRRRPWASRYRRRLP